MYRGFSLNSREFFNVKFLPFKTVKVEIIFSSLDQLQVLPMLEEVEEVPQQDLQELEVVVEPFVKEKLQPVGLELEP